jgi:hypothetical protein
MASNLRLRRLCVALFVLACSCGPATAAGPEPEPTGEGGPAGSPSFEPSRFIRVVRDTEGKPASLETATVRYVPANPDGPADLTVDLVAVTHVGETGYFGGLNGQLADYDAVLYELVAPKGAVPQKGAGGGMIPSLLKSTLQLEYQTEQIDYTRANFVHADLTPRQIGDKMRERGQTGLSVALDAFGSMFAEAGRRAERGEDDGDLAGFGLTTLLLDPNGKSKLKRAFALELERAEMDKALGETAGRMLITDRNEAAVAVLREQIDAGRRRVAIFYGAGHMPDLERRLASDFGLERQGSQWREAWDLVDKP